MKYTFSILEKITKIHRTTLLRRYKRDLRNGNDWGGINEKSNGGWQIVFSDVSKLPPKIQNAIIIYNKENGLITETLNMLPSLAPEAMLTATDQFMNIQNFSDNMPVISGKVNRDAPTPEIIAQRDKAGRDYAAFRKDKVRVRAKIIHQALNMPPYWTKGQSAWIDKIATENEVSRPQVYKLIRKYKKGGYVALDHTKSYAGQAKKWTPEALNWWLGMALKKGHENISLLVLYEDALLIEARRNSWEIGGYASAIWWYRKKATPQMLALQKGGVKMLDNKLTPIYRKYSDLYPFEILCGDQHRFDFWVMDIETGEVFRAECFIWQDLRTRVIYGAAVTRHYCGATVGLAARMGIKIFGLFNSVYTDNGKPELSEYFISIRKELAGLDVHFKNTVEYYDEIIAATDGEEIQPLMRSGHQHIKAIVENAKAKMAESTNRVIEGILSSKMRIPGHVKNLSSSQEEQDVIEQRVKKMAKEGLLLTFEEFVLRFYKAIDYYNREHDHRGVKKEWMWDEKPEVYSPMACLKMCWKNGWKPRKVSDAVLDMIFLHRENRTPNLGVITFQNDYYTSKDLQELQPHTKVEIRYDPLDPSRLAVFKDGNYLCTAWPVEYSSMKNLTLAQKKIIEKRKNRKAFITQYNQLTSAVPDFIAYSEVPKEERAAALMDSDLKKKKQERLELTRVLTPEEINEGILQLEELNSLPKKSVRSQKLPARPGTWTSEALRHEWCLKVDAAGGELTDDDKLWLADYESRMTPEARERWEFEREYNRALAQGGN